jgi:hypothetical protein
MNRSITLAAIFILSVLAACDRKTPVASDTRVESASEAMRNDSRAIAERLAEQKASTDATFQQGRAKEERAQFVESLTAVGRRWSDALDETGRVGRSDLAPAIKKLETIKAEADAAAVNECTGRARAALTASMATSIDTYNQFRAGSGKPDDAAQQKLQQAAVQFSDFEKQLGGCL